MAGKDITEKILEAYDDVFSDIVNVLLFDGKEVVRPEELVDQNPKAAYKADGKVREIERDVAKRWMQQNIRIACIGFENQTKIDKDMPLRVFGYDGAEYRAQLDTPDRYPVVTLVLYFGYEKHWDKPLNLLGRVKVPEEFLPFVQDYRINLFEIAYLSEEKVKSFKSDFRVVADYFVQMRKNRDYVPDSGEIKHVQEVLQLLNVMTGDDRYEQAYRDSREEVPRNMCEVLDRIENKGRVEGRKEGRMEGRKEGRKEGHKEGRTQGLTEGRAEIFVLMQKLFDEGRMEDAKRAANDEAFQKAILEEFGLSTPV